MPVMPQPIEMEVSIKPAEFMAEGAPVPDKFIAISFSTGQGLSVFFVPINDAVRLGTEIIESAKRAKIGLEVVRGNGHNLRD